jgi:hypothetical protein
MIKQAVYSLRELLQASTEHQSIDEYAKLLFINDRDRDYTRLKNLVILFFELYNYYTNRVDKRYGHFLASILKKSAPRFPPNINIISWNYDYEFEKAFSKYYNIKDRFEEVYTELSVQHKGIAKPYENSTNFNLFKINGTIGYKNQSDLILGLGNFFYKSEIEKKLNNERVTPLISKSNSLSGNSLYTPALSFAWEEDTQSNIVIDNAVNIMRATKTLVVIGYSFPNFNRKIDKLLLNEENLQWVDKIYVQDKDAHEIIDKIKEYRPLKFQWDHIEFIPITNLQQFYIPHEH